MSEKHLLLSSAKSGVLISSGSRDFVAWFNDDSTWSARVRIGALAVGLAVVVVGGVDILSRVAPTMPNNTGYLAFAPAIVALDPSVLPFLTPASGATTTPLTPARLAIPSLNVDARVEEVGVKENGQMANPSGFSTVGWYKYGSEPGGEGRAVIAGHVNNALGLSGVFARLSEIAIGEKIVVSDSTGRTLTYIVQTKNQYDSSDAPLAEIFKITGPSELVLITCEGDWIPSARSYDKRLVVVARLAL